MLIWEAVTALNSVSKTAETFCAEMQQLAKLLPEYSVVMNTYGIGPATSPQLIVEIGDVRRFTQRGALIAYAGVNPQPSQSGKQRRSSDPISRKGSNLIRKTLFQVMEALLRKSPSEKPVSQFIDRKRDEGKPYFVYMTAATNKFLRIYYAWVKEHLNTLREYEK
jgi:Transposase and inactivated derivatives